MTDNKPITLSEDESKEIVEMMKQNQSPKKPKEKKSPKEIKQAQKDAANSYKHIKKILKTRSKAELIELVWQYGVQLNSMQHAAQLLLEENKELKEQIGEEK